MEYEKTVRKNNYICCIFIYCNLGICYTYMYICSIHVEYIYKNIHFFLFELRHLHISNGAYPTKFSSFFFSFNNFLFESKNNVLNWHKYCFVYSATGKKKWGNDISLLPVIPMQLVLSVVNTNNLIILNCWMNPCVN